MYVLPSDPATASDEWLRLLSEQHGVLHRAEIPPEFKREVMRALHRGQWQRGARDVFVAHNGPLTPHQELLVVVKAAPPRSALSGLTSAQLGGLKGFEHGGTYITVPCGTSMPKLPGIAAVVKYSRFLDSRDVHPLLHPRRTRMPRSLLDGAAWAKTDMWARSIILAGVQQRLAAPSQLAEVLPRRGPCLRHALIAETISDAAGGVESVPEREFEGIRRQHGLPEPNRQRVVQRASGRYYLDADWDDYGVAAEVDGMPHMGILSWDADLDRMNEIAIDHRTLLRFTAYAIRHRPRDVGHTLARALISRGWTGM